MPESASGEKHKKKLTPKKSHEEGCVTKHEDKFTDDRCAYRYQGYKRIKATRRKHKLYKIDFTKKKNAKRLPRLYREKKIGPFPKKKASSWFTAPDPRVDKKAWWLTTGINYQDANVPYTHNYHHILPFEAIKRLTYDELDLVQAAGYNLNAGVNLIILPCLDEYGRAMMLPAHPYNHGEYNKDVKKLLNTIRQDLSAKTKGHKLTKKNASKFRTKIENWEKNEFWVLVDFGRSEVDEVEYPTVNDAPVTTRCGR
jgi:hypothetical protein